MSKGAFMPAGNMAGNWQRRLDSHMFAGSKAPWSDITDDAPQLDITPEGTAATGIDNPERPPATASIASRL